MSLTLGFVSEKKEVDHELCPLFSPQASSELCSRCPCNVFYPGEPWIGCSESLSSRTVDEIFGKMDSIDPDVFRRFERILDQRIERGTCDGFEVIEGHTQEEIREVLEVMKALIKKNGTSDDDLASYLDDILALCNRSLELNEPVAIYYFL